MNVYAKCTDCTVVIYIYRSSFKLKILWIWETSFTQLQALYVSVNVNKIIGGEL